MALYGSVIELAGCILILVRLDSNAGLGAVLRAQLEVYVDLVNLADDRSYLEYIDVADLKQLRSVYSAAVSGNAYLAGVTESPLFPSAQDYANRQWEALTEKGITPLRIYEKFERVGARELYDGVYALLCTDAHSNGSALVSRHLDPLGDGGFRVAYYKPASEEELRTFLDSSAGMLVDATERVYAALECEVPAALSARLGELEEVRSTYLD